MAIYEQSALLRRKDQNGNEHLLYPITKFDCVDGLDEAFEDVYARLESVGSGSNSGAGSGSGPIDQVQSDWNQNDETAVDFIKNKPFGETAGTVTFFDGDYRYFFDETLGAWYSDVIPLVPNAHLSVGDYVTVTWNGTVYECECFAFEGFVAAGTRFPFTGEDDGIPFIILEDTIGMTPALMPGFVFMPLPDPDPSVTTEVTFAIKLDVLATVTKKIDPKYVDVSWAGLSDKPDILDYTPPTTDLRPTKTIVTDELHPGFNMYYMEERDSGYTLKVGETYMVEWDGVTYTCVGIDVSAVFGIPGSVAIGNGAAAGLPGNNEPFIIGKFNDDWKSYIPLTDTTIGGSHTVRIYRVNEVLPPTVKLSSLPLMGYMRSETVDVLPTKTLTDFELHSLTGWYEVSEEDDSYSLTAGETYNVEWDGTVYECIAQDIGGGSFPDGTVALGDGIDLGAQGNGEPFFLGQIGGGNQKLYYSQTDSSTDVSHTVRIFKVLGGGSYTEGYKIKPEYLPTLHYTPPVNELLPEKTFTGFTLDSTWGLYQVTEEDPNYTLKVGETYVVEWDGVTYECVGIDVSAIFGVSGSVAIGNGIIADLPGNNEPFIIGKFNGDWKGYISLTDTDSTGSHAVRIYQVNENAGYKIKKEYLPDTQSSASGLPEVTTEDDGKILRVVGGVWSAVALPNAEEASF